MTKNGKIILEIIESVSCHPTAEEIYQLTKERGYKMSLATVYNNLLTLCENEQIRRLTNPNQPDRYDKTMRHDHLVCSKCGKIKDVFFKDLTEVLAKEAKVELKSYDLTLFYECDECME